MAKIIEAESIANKIMIRETQKLGRELTERERKIIKKKVNEIVKRNVKEEKRANKRQQTKGKGLRKWPRLVAILTALGLSGILGQKLLEAPKEVVATEREENQENKRKNFLESLKEDKSNDGSYIVTEEELSQYKSIYTEMSDIEKAVNQLKDKEDILAFLKDMYIEQYEKITGDTTLTTADIKFYINNYQDYVFVNKETGEIVTHGTASDATKQKLEGEYDIAKDLNVFLVMSDKDNKAIDAVTLNNTRVVLGDNYNEMKDYTSVLASSNDENLANIIFSGIRYAENIENENLKEETKKNFIEQLEVADKGKEQSNEGYEMVD